MENEAFSLVKVKDISNQHVCLVNLLGYSYRLFGHESFIFYKQDPLIDE